LELHLTDQDILRLHQRNHTPSELLVFDEHLADCSICAARLAQLASLTATYQTLQQEFAYPPPDVCDWLDEKRIADFLDQLTNEAETAEINAHLKTCDACRTEVESYRALHASLPMHRVLHPGETRLRKPFWLGRWPVPTWQAATALLALVGLTLSAWYVWRPGNEKLIVKTPSASPTPLAQASPAPSPLSSPLPPAAPGEDLIVLNDGGGQVRLSKDGRLSGLAGLAPATEQLVIAALTTGRVTLSPELTRLSGVTGQLQGSADVPFSLLSPVAQVIRPTRPRFRWEPLAGASSYTISIYDEQDRPVATAENVSVTEWTPPKALSRGKTYFWQVRAIKEENEILAPQPQQPDAKFVVLSQAENLALGKAEAENNQAKLLLGILYAKAGLTEEARSAFQQVQNQNPQTALPKKLLQSLRR
jgi:predicted anti-sigma-YlaC factor YlaD